MRRVGPRTVVGRGARRGGHYEQSGRLRDRCRRISTSQGRRGCHPLLIRNGRILLRERANTGYGDGAYEPPTGQLADRETIVETAVASRRPRRAWRSARETCRWRTSCRTFPVAADRLLPDRVGLGGRVLLARCALVRRRRPAHDMLDRSRVALRNYAEGMRFSTYPAFGTGGSALLGATAGRGRTPSAPKDPPEEPRVQIRWARWSRS